MFSNFVTFTEVVKLSSNVFQKMKEVNYSSNILDFIFSKEDMISLEQVEDLVNSPVDRFFALLEVKEFKWQKELALFLIKMIFRGNYNDLNSCNGILIVYFSFIGPLDLIKYFIEKGADINGRGGAALLCAVYNDCTEIAKFLIESKIIIHPNVLFQAVSKNNLEIIKFLVENNEELKVEKELLITQAIDQNNLEIIKYFYNHEHHSNHLFDFVIFSTEKGNLDIIKYFLEKLEPNSEEFNGVINQVLVEGKRFYHNNIVRFALENGADIKLITKECEELNPDLIRSLINIIYPVTQDGEIH